MAQIFNFDEWLKEEYQGTHPVHLAETTFPDNVMEIIGADHHKQNDGSFTIAYNHYEKKWYISHNGYIREVEVEGDSYIDAAQKYIMAISRENGKVLYQQVIDEVNSQLPEDISVKIEDNAITIFKCEKGKDRINVIACRDCKSMTAAEILAEVKELIKEEEDDKY